MYLERERAVAIEAVTEACCLCRNVQNRIAGPLTVAKLDASPVTVADFGSQALIISRLRTIFPNDTIIGEEEASLLRREDQQPLKNEVVSLVQLFETDLTEEMILNAIDYGARSGDFRQRYWTLDPIDGTKGFLRGDQYAVALALVEDGQPVLGVLGCPNLPEDDKHSGRGKGMLFIAVKDRGAVMRPLNGGCEQIAHVDSVTDPSNARFCDSVEAAHVAHDQHAKIAGILGISTPAYHIDSQCKYAVVAGGDASIYLRLTPPGYYSCIWDHAAGVAVIREAGGNVTDVYGRTLDFSLGRRLFKNVGVVATNGHLHAAVIAAVQQIL
ncbi:3'(2'),5'-bisphosphate nucleotidase [candidate division KSB3 bacterium]|uniref:3'(2'),5'-bisphosphate nucleotidase n=1 Tax=candidate division KSB3 bacterium TaxID=2044937 RepID=A0A2G6E2R7_9BACT|nr:MAG: 3'(2'),5'-bisphosphate nucleotidase [candidate division KSB3 bacterium]PIE28725.1 MAG: 3'(2'),5'-bisphosphate nucleotidase [candidate division KSB3 bacterium]